MVRSGIEREKLQVSAHSRSLKEKEDHEIGSITIEALLSATISEVLDSIKANSINLLSWKYFWKRFVGPRIATRVGSLESNWS